MLIIKKLISKRGIFLFPLSLSFIIYNLLFNIQAVFAQTKITINPPKGPGGSPIGYTEIGSFISNVLTVLYSIAVIVVLFFLVWGAYEWMTSGGDKESVGRARGRILNALIGLAVLAVAFALYQVAARFLGFNPLELIIPTPV